VNKIPPNFDTLFAATVVAVRLFKGLNARPLYRPFGVKGLTPVLKQCRGMWLQNELPWLRQKWYYGTWCWKAVLCTCCSQSTCWLWESLDMPSYTEVWTITSPD